VLLGGLTTYAVGLVTSAHSGYARELAASRADQAAQAGLDWGQYRVRALPAPTCTAVQSITTLPGALQPYTVTVRCVATGPYTEGAATPRAYRLTATACNRPLAGACPNTVASADYVERTLTTLIVR
jgi:MSHA biogenesis protein MshP